MYYELFESFEENSLEPNQPHMQSFWQIFHISAIKSCAINMRLKFDWLKNLPTFKIEFCAKSEPLVRE